MNTVAYELPEGVDTEAAQMLAQARAYSITSPDMYECAGADLQAIKAKQKELEAKRTTITKPLNAAVKAVNDLFRAPADYLEQAEKILKGAMLAYQREEEKKRIAAEAAAREAQRAAQEALAKEAAAAIDAGKPEQAEMLQQQAAIITTPAVHVPETKAHGISTRENWKARVNNKMELIKAVAEGRAPETLLMVDEKALNQMAKALKGAMNVPGCEAYDEPVISARAA